MAYVAAALVESNLDPTAIGDNGDSVGLFQENINGRGHGLSVAQRQDPVANARRAAEEFARSRGSGPERAYNAQRPADRADYLAKVRSRMEEARAILRGGQSGSTPGAAPRLGGAKTPTELSNDDLSGYALAALADRQPGESLTRSIGQQFLASKLASSLAPADEASSAPAGNKRRQDSTAQFGGKPGGFRAGGGPEGHGARALGNWQSDNAYDIMGKTGQEVYAPVSGTVTRISGQPGGDPGFAGYGITVRTSEGDLFFKHLGTRDVEVGSRITPGQRVGTLDAATRGGPHIHLGGTNRRQLDRLNAWYLGRQ